MNGEKLFNCMKSASDAEDVLRSMEANLTSQRDTNATKQSKRGNVFEKMWDLVIKFGMSPDLLNSEYDHYQGNINIPKTLKKVENLSQYIKTLSVLSKGKGGSSDITCRHKTSGHWVFVSSKYYADDDKKLISDYDVQNILANINEHPNIYQKGKYQVFLIVNNKEKVLRCLSACHETNNYITNNIKKIMDIKDLEG